MISTDPVAIAGRPPGLISAGERSLPLARGADVELASGGARVITGGGGGGVAEGGASRVESLVRSGAFTGAGSLCAGCTGLVSTLLTGGSSGFVAPSIVRVGRRSVSWSVGCVSSPTGLGTLGVVAELGRGV